MRFLPSVAAAATVAVVVPVSLALRVPDGADRRPRVAAEGPRSWTGTATLLQLADKKLTLCGGVTLTSLPPAGCGGAEVQGLDPMSIEGAEKYPNGTITTPSVRLVGTWQDRVLTVTQPPVLAEREQGPDDGVPGPGCAEPDGGWPFDRVDQAGWSRVQEYASRQPDAGVARVDQSQRIFTVPFTGDLDRHRAAVAELYDGPLCVEQVRYSTKELAAVFARVQAELKRRGLQMMGGSPGGSGTPYVEADVVGVSPEERAEIEASFDGKLRLTSFLEPVDQP